MATLEHLSRREREGPSEAGRVRDYAVAERNAEVPASYCAVPNPSSSHAFGAGPSFSLREKVWRRGA